jgi:alpha-glucosidase
MNKGSMLCCLLASLPVQADWEGTLDSPGGSLEARITLDRVGRLWYQVLRGGSAVIRPSPLGISLHNGDFETDLIVASVSAVAPVSDSYRLWTGKRRQAEYRANQLSLDLANSAGRPLVVTFRLSDDGLAYRYQFPGHSEDTRVVVSERSGVHFFPETRAWLQPKAEAQSGWSKVNPSYEEDYLQDIPVGTSSPATNGWVYPALFRYRDTWIVLSETGMDGRYAGSSLAADGDDGLYRVRFPQPAEVITNGQLLPEAKLPFGSPWRLVVVGDLATIVESTLGTDLAVPSKLAETDFIEPGISAWSWGLLKDDATVYPVQKDFIDYAAAMHWPYVLVDADWDRKIGYEGIAELAGYAAGKDVSLLLWYNSSGAWNETIYTPKSRLLTRADRRAEFARLRDMGIRGVKVDFFPGDGASVMRYYQDILRDAAEHGLVVNFHGASLPRGIQRTWPNLLTVEAVKGFEFITFEQENADREATHSAMLPFTRNLFDPMDFTPLALGDIPDRERRTSNGFQLALPVLFTSGIQHLVTTPGQMEAMPEFVKDYLRNMPARWDDSRFVEGFPGRYVVIARRAGERWYVAGINAETASHRFDLDLSFVGPAEGVLIRDGDSPRRPEQVAIGTADHGIVLAPGTGFVMIFKP